VFSHNFVASCLAFSWVRDSVDSANHMVGRRAKLEASGEVKLAGAMSQALYLLKELQLNLRVSAKRTIPKHSASQLEE